MSENTHDGLNSDREYTPIHSERYTPVLAISVDSPSDDGWPSELKVVERKSRHVLYGLLTKLSRRSVIMSFYFLKVGESVPALR